MRERLAAADPDLRGHDAGRWCSSLTCVEETAWSGFVKGRLMARHGLLVGSLLMAPLS